MSKKQKKRDKKSVGFNEQVETTPCHSAEPLSLFSFSEKLSSWEWMRWTIIALFPVFVILTYPVDGGDPDLWWQMALGKYYVTHYTLTVDHSIFSWTPTDPTWIYNTCLGSIIIYLFYNGMGGLGLWIMHSLVFGAVFLSFYCFLRLLNQRLDVNSVTIIAAIAIGCSPACRYYKPELFSLLMFCWTLFVFFHVKVSGRKFLFYFYPLIFVLWVNLHGGFVVGVVFLAMAFIGEILNRIFFPKESLTNEILIHFGIANILSLAFTLLNPYGVDYLKSIYTGITSPVYAEINKYIFSYVSFWPFLKTFRAEFFNVGLSAWIMTLMLLALLILSVYELIKRKSCDFTVLIISLALYWKGMETSRASYFFLVSFFFIVFYLLIHRLKLNNIYNRSAIFSLSVFICFIISVVYINIRYNVDSKWFGAGLDDAAPVKEVAFLKQYKLEGPIFNDYMSGGYLMWDLYPDYKVFIDPRGSLYGNQVFFDYMNLTAKRVTRDDINDFTNKYPFKIAIISYQPIILNFLKAGDEWHLLYCEKNAAILIHKSLVPVVASKMGMEIKDPKIFLNAFCSPSRFSDVRNPKMLFDLFNFYVRIDTKAGRHIYEIFGTNVSDYFKPKDEYLHIMEMELMRREQ